MSHTASPVAEPERVHVLDVLRGIALLGMFLVHFSIVSADAGTVGEIYKTLVYRLFEERFWAMFAMLFGVGFAIQLRRAEGRGGSFVPKYLRRLAALAVFGFIAHAFFGYNVLLAYAIWGLPLLLVRRWSVRSLLIAAVLCAVSWSAYAVGKTAYAVRARGEQVVRVELDSAAARSSAFRKANHDAQQSTSYRTVFRARVQHMKWFYAQPYSFLPVNDFTLFLLGLIALRLGLFDEPERHRRLIVGLAIFGVVSWVSATWLLPLIPPVTKGSLLRVMILNRLHYGFMLIREMWLAFTYMGLVLLLVARNRQWLRRLGALAWTGRMALTNYMIQIAILDLAFSKYALGLVVTPLVGLTMALALFFADALASRWWLSRFRYGPLEWLWRSITYAKWQPIRLPLTTSPAAEELVAIRP